MVWQQRVYLGWRLTDKQKGQCLPLGFPPPPEVSWCDVHDGSGSGSAGHSEFVMIRLFSAERLVRNVAGSHAGYFRTSCAVSEQ